MIPEVPTVSVRFSTQLLREMEASEGPLRLVRLGGPDYDGFYEPVFALVSPAQYRPSVLQRIRRLIPGLRPR